MAMVNSEIYDFLRDVAAENHLSIKKGEVIAVTLVNFRDMYELVDAFGEDTFDEGGLEITMLNGYIGLELNEIFEGYGNSILDYKGCFPKQEVQEYMEELKRQAEE